MAKKKKEEVVYSEKYRKPYPIMHEDSAPKMFGLLEVGRVEMIEAGKIEIDGEQKEYNIVRIIEK